MAHEELAKQPLIKKFLEGEKNYLFVTGEDIFSREYLSSGSIDRLKAFIGNKDILVIDEAQYIPNIGLNLKLVVDHIPHLKVVYDRGFLMLWRSQKCKRLFKRL
jgi:hypothetical protein